MVLDCLSYWWQPELRKRDDPDEGLQEYLNSDLTRHGLSSFGTDGVSAEGNFCENSLPASLGFMAFDVGVRFPRV